MIWQRIRTRRASALRGHGRLNDGHFGAWQHEGRTAGQVGAWRNAKRVRAWRPYPRCQPAQMPPLVIREPESSWWETQAKFGELEATPEGPTTTIAVLREREAESDAVVERLAELASADELLVVFGSASSVQPGEHAVISGLRGRLPRHDVVAVDVGREEADVTGQVAAIERFLEAGTLPVVVTAPAVVHDVTAAISSYVRADRVLRVFHTPIGAELHQVWRREPEPSIN